MFCALHATRTDEDGLLDGIYPLAFYNIGGDISQHANIPIGEVKHSRGSSKDNYLTFVHQEKEGMKLIQIHLLVHFVEYT